MALNIRFILCFFPGSIQRWIYAQPLRSAVTDICEDMAGLKLSSEDSCQSKGRQNEHLVQSVMEVIQEMTNPFKDTDDLQSLSTGKVTSAEAKYDLLHAYDKGYQASLSFIADRITDKTVDFYAPVGLLKLKTFAEKNSNSKSSKVSKQLKQTNRDLALFSRLLVVSQVRHVDLEIVLGYSLSDVPLSLSSSDGTIAKTAKSKLLHILENEADNTILSINLSETAVIFDAMAIIQALPKSELPQSFKLLAEMVLKKVKQRARYHKATRVDFVCDRYILPSIKSAERESRAQNGTQRIKIAYPDQKLPNQWSKFLSNSSNKNDLLRFLLNQWSTSGIQDLEFYTTYYNIML